MGVMDWILLSAIAAYMVFVLFFKKNKGCCGDCSRCSSCHKANEKTPLCELPQFVRTAQKSTPM